MGERDEMTREGGERGGEEEQRDDLRTPRPDVREESRTSYSMDLYME